MIHRIIAALFVCGVVACSDRGTDNRTPNDGASAGAALPSGGATGSGGTAPAGRTLPAGTTMQATIQQSVSSRTNTTGQHINAIVSLNVSDVAGLVTIPGGSVIVLTISQLEPASKPEVVDGVIAFEIASLAIAGVNYAPHARVESVPHTLLARGASRVERDVIVSPGTPIRITLTQPLKIAAN